LYLGVATWGSQPHQNDPSPWWARRTCLASRSPALTISNAAVNTAALTINDITVAIGDAVQFKVLGQAVANSPYTLKITVSTDSTPAQTKIGYVTFGVEA
jgi:hypothetical protein